MQRMFRRFIVALGCSAVLSACADTAVAPTAVPASPTPVAAVPKSAVGNKLPGFGVAFLPLNENRCEERTAVTDASGKIVAWTRTPSQVTPRFAGQASAVSAYSILTFSASSHQQTSQFDCVLQSGSEALPFMKAQLATRHTLAAVRTLGGTTGYSLDGDTGTCEWDGWGLTCEGDACVRGYAPTRAPGASSTAPAPGPAARIEMGALGAWHCGSCNVFISESGSVFNCGDDDPPGDGGDEGGGGCGGGGLMVSSCEPPPCTHSDPGCKQALNGADSAAMNAMWNWMRDPNTISDSADRAKCQEMENWLIIAFQQNRIFRGAWDTVTPWGYENAEMGDSTVHVDLHVLNDAAASDDGKRYLFSVLLHEMAHLHGHHHTGETAGPYSAPYHNLVNHVPPNYANTCVR